MENKKNYDNEWEKYFGTKEIYAIQMTYGDYQRMKYGDNKFISSIPQDSKGYAVKYEDDYISWSPKEAFRFYKKINGNLSKVSLNDLGKELLTEDHTYILHDEVLNNAPHNYLIKNKDNHDILVGIHFQCGPVNEVDLNGIFLPDMIAVCIDMIEHFQSSDFKCKENDIAIDGLKAAITALRARTNNRKERGVHGKFEK